MNIKQELFKQCEAFVNKRAQTVDEIISSNQNALESEAKSSAGDKHETGRAMLQLEMEKASQQFAGIQEMKEILSKINTTKTSKIAHLGSIIFTDTTNYFLSISAGKLTVDENDFFAISVSSPIGKILLGSNENKALSFNGKEIKIREIL
ncbi:3-oxoacyl-ACP synthase [Polaribacter glomeratus]|uniref:3-oxoacyl-ACP synthase n=1 Tax=Polaribacter glomeratus TaxID=102 RepID=A0A2S7WH06_9FLAO|nr:3-oxoacyl-ACP synthase [Polaribacter glomeratus]PQJ76885.1 3-oxoacyl-ACP synthase [Polaribacter glomeratus]TXD67271.1 3-oxoacyl-ACP synthase [Polaribacter glomeratus]